MNQSTVKSVVFIEPASSETNVFEDYMRLPLMGSLYLGTILHNAGYEVRIYNETILRKRVDPFMIQADVYCITSLTVSANRAKLLAAQIRDISPDARILVGGIHASLLPEEFANVADHVVWGEAEDIIIDLVEGKFEEHRVQGERIKDVNNLPKVNYGLLEGLESVNIIPLMTSRGCPFDCNFCTVTQIFGRRFRMQSAERVIEEIEHALQFFNTRDVFFYDDNFTANRKRIHELCDLILERRIDITWTVQTRSDIAQDPELIRKMARAGCHTFYIGFESISDETLKAMHKSQTREDIEAAIQTIHDQNMNIHGMFIFGSDTDTLESIQATVDFAIEQDVDTVQFMILTPFPGTGTYAAIEGENRLLHRNWDYFNGMYIVFQPTNMSAARLQQETLEAYRRFYSLRRVAFDTIKMLAGILLDALVWDFTHVFRYDFKTLLLIGGGRFIVGKYSETQGPYLAYLDDLAERRAKRAMKQPLPETDTSFEDDTTTA